MNYKLKPILLILALTVLFSACKNEAKNSKPSQIEPETLDVPTTQKNPVTTDKKSSLSKETIKKNNNSVSKITTNHFANLKKEQLSNPVIIKPLKDGSVVLLIIDALNAQHLSAYGYERNTSQSIDKIANEGLLLTNYTSNSSWTRPSFTTIVTGVPKSIHNVEAAGGWRLEPEIVTISERFKKAGYRTAGFTGNPLVRKSWGFDQGYQVYEGPTTKGIKAFPRDKVWINDAINWLDTVPKEKPFFLMLFLTAPHPPYAPPEKPRTFLSTLPEGKIIEHPFREYKQPLPKDDHDRLVAAYDDEIQYMDGQIERLMNHIEKLGRTDNTVVALTADHGEMMGEHNCYLHAYHMWENNIRVPFMIKAPNLGVSDLVDERPFTHIDVVPTLLDLVGIPYDNTKLKGVSIVKALANLSINKERIRYTQVNAHGVKRQTVRQNGVKLVHHNIVPDSVEKTLDNLHPDVKMPNPRDLPTLAFDNERWEIFNILDDPTEDKNIYGTEQIKEIQTLLKTVLDDKLDKNSDENAPLAPELLEALKNAGYIR